MSATDYLKLVFTIMPLAFLADLLIDRLSPIAAETTRLLADEPHLRATLATGAARATALSTPIVAEAERLVGFLS